MVYLIIMKVFLETFSLSEHLYLRANLTFYQRTELLPIFDFLFPERQLQIIL